MSSFLKIPIPSEWQIKKLKDCVTINPENLNTNGIKGNHINYIDIASIDNSTCQIKEIKEIPISNIPSRARRVIKENDVIVSTVRPYLKAFSKIKREHNNFICSTGFAVLRAKEELNYEYLFQWVLSQKFVNYMISQMVGSSYPAVNMSDVEVAPIFLPPLNEQLRIGSILANVDYMILKTQYIIDDLRVLKKGLMQRLLTRGIGHTEFKETRLGKISKEWDIKILNNVISMINSGTWGDDPKEGERAYPVLRSTEIKHDGRIDLSTVEYRTVSQNNIERYTLNNNDILIVSSSGSPRLIGRTAYFLKSNQKQTYLFSNFMLRLRPDSINPHYLYYYLNSSRYKRFLSLLQQTATGLRNLPKNDFVKLKIPYPSLDEQNEIVSILSNIDKKVENELYYQAKLKVIKKGLMQDLLTGKKRVKIN